MNKILVSLFLTGILFGSGPCIASCGPFLISYIAGTGKRAAGGLMVYILFSSARISVYIALSLGIFFLSRLTIERLLGGMQGYLLAGGGIFMIVIGLFVASGRKPGSGFCRSLGRNLLERDKKSIFAAGVIIGLLPCLPLLSALSYIGLVSRRWTESVLYSLSFGIGTLISPMILLVLLSGLIQRFFSGKNGTYQSALAFICGLVIIFLGAQLIGRAF